jgi:outer membrane protein assembly factor BamB
MLAGGDRLYIPQGRAAPITLNQNDGKKTGTIGQAGGTFCLLTEDNQLIAGPPNQKERDEQLRIADPKSGKRLTTFNNTTRVVVTEGKAYLHSIGNLQCLDLTRKAQLETLLSSQRAALKKLDPKVETNLAQIEILKKKISTHQAQIKSCLLWTITHPTPFELVVAGTQLIVGLDNQVSILDIKTGKPLWHGKSLRTYSCRGPPHRFY